jgi:Zn-dependent protease with chaperone function
VTDHPLPEDQRLKELSSKAYEHPADRAATAALQSIPMLDQVVRRLIEYGYERALRQIFLAGSVRIGDDQMPKVWAAHRAALARLDVTVVPDLYLTQFPIANAAAIGAGKPMVMLNSRSVELFDEGELRTVLGHEAGHILSDHVMYETALMILLSISGIGRLPLFAGLPLIAVRMALLEWFRAAELSCDRAATLVNRDPRACPRRS